MLVFILIGMYIDPLLTLKGEPWRVLIELSDSLYLDSLAAMGIDVVTESGRFATATITGDDLNELKGKDYIVRLEMAKPVEFFNDKGKEAINLTPVISIHGDAKDVVVGIIDQGIDLSHPGFLNNGRSIFSGLWDQTVNSSNPPPWFDYGRWYSHEDISQNLPDLDETGHGTAISGTICGRDSVYGGILRDGNFYFVKIIPDEMGVIDGLSFLISVAESLNLPLIVNMSLGHRFGPHDGQTLFERFLSDITINSTINVYPVASAGNYGGSFVHSGGLTTFGDSSFLSIDSTSLILVNLSSEDSITCISIYYPEGSSQNIRLSLNNSYFSDWFRDTLLFIKSGLPSQIDSILFYSGNYNQCYHQVFVVLFKKPGGFNNYFGINLFGDIGTRVDAWVTYGKSRFINASGIYKRIIPPEDRYQIGPPGSSPNVITAGAFTSRTGWNTITGEWVEKGGEIYEPAIWTSRGRIGGFVKPDFLLPGRYIVSFYSGDESVSPDLVVGSGLYSSYGTSYSCAFLTGVIAILLSLDGERDVIQALKVSSTMFNNPDSISGYGIPDVEAAAGIVSFGIALVDFGVEVKRDQRVGVYWRQGSVENEGEWVLYRDSLVVFRTNVFQGQKDFRYEDVPGAGKHSYKLYLLLNGRMELKAKEEADIYTEGLKIVNNLDHILFLPSSEKATVRIYNLIGEKVDEILVQDVPKTFYPPCSGIYFVRYRSIVKRVLLLK